MFVLEKEKMTDEEKTQRTHYMKTFGLSKKEYKTLIQSGFSFLTHTERNPTQMDDTLTVMQRTGFVDNRIIRTGDVLSVDVSVPVLRLMRALQK